MKKWVKNAGVVVVFFVSFFLFGCKEKKAESKYVLTLGRSTEVVYADPVIDTAFSENLFEKFGLKVNTVKLSKSALLNSVATGKVNASHNSVLYNLNLGAHGEDVILYGGTMTGGQGLLANKKVADEVRDVKNWKGKTIAGQVGGTGEMVVKTFLSNEYDYILDKDYSYKPFESDAETIAGASKGNVDIIIVSNNYVDTAIKQGYVYLFPLTDIEDDFVCCRQMANGTHFKENRSTYLAYLKALISAYKIYKTDEERVLTVLQNPSGQTREWLYDYIYNLDKNQRRFYGPDPNYNGVKGYYETMLNLGYIETPRELTEFFDISLYAQALREIIAENPNDQIYKDLWMYFVEHNNKYPNFNQDYPERF